MKQEEVNYPARYNQYSVEAIDMMIAIWGPEKTADWCEMTAFKYRMRLGHKDDIEQELAKEKWYLDKAKELREHKFPRNFEHKTRISMFGHDFNIAFQSFVQMEEFKQLMVLSGRTNNQ